MSRERFLPLIRELVESTRAFETLSARHIRTLDLTPPQFDIIVTLGDTAGMSCKDLGEKTLITKGTLTGVLDRLEAKGLLARAQSPNDGRSWHIALTTKGEALYEKIFPEHLDHVRPAFANYSDEALESLRRELTQLREAFQALTREETESP